MKTFMEEQKNRLLRKFHRLLVECGAGSEEKAAMLASYGVESSRDLTVYELTELCNRIDLMLPARQAAIEADKWRKRVMGAIGGWLELKTGKSSAALIKAIAERAAGRPFNKIPTSRLRNLYNEFLNKQKDASAGESAARLYDIGMN